MTGRRRTAIAALCAGLAVAVLTSCGSAQATQCAAEIAPVDPDATEAAWCAAARMDDWKKNGVMGIGQQLDVQEPGRMRQPLEALEPNHPAVVGFDFAELLNAQKYFNHDPVPFLAEQFGKGRVLAATWHADNPATGGRFDDRSWTSLEELLDPSTPAARSFWTSYDAVLEQAKRLQDAGAAVVFKPLHEASGGWFWWGKPDPATYTALYAQLQDRAAAAGVHNILWAYAANPQNYSTDDDPVPLIPDRIDLIGIDTYDAEVEQPVNTLALNDFERLSALAPRMALTEVGPYNRTSGDWDPSVITRTLTEDGLYATYAMLWRDDPPGGYVYQVSSLTGGPEWLASCPDGLCPLG